MLITANALFIALAFQAASPQPTPDYGLLLTGEQAEQFLRTAKVLELKIFGNRGVTRPRRAVLTDGDRELKAVFKDIDDFEAVKELEDATILNFRDSYRHEIAAYQLDLMLDLGIVPPCVRRRIGSDVGSLCMWVEGAITEWERKFEKKISPPDLEAWNQQMHTIRLFLQLIDDMDYKNVSNLLVTPDFKIYKIDSSRAFSQDSELRKERSLTRFSRSLLASLRRMDEHEVEARLHRYLNNAQIKALMARRDRILRLAEERIAAQGEEGVLYP